MQQQVSMSTLRVQERTCSKRVYVESSAWQPALENEEVDSQIDAEGHVRFGV